MGKQIESYEFNERGQGVLTIDSYEMEAGTYLHSLIVDNVEIGSKKMILTK